MKKRIHCEACASIEPMKSGEQCPCVCHPFGVKWQKERARREREFADLMSGSSTRKTSIEEERS